MLHLHCGSFTIIYCLTSNNVLRQRCELFIYVKVYVSLLYMEQFLKNYIREAIYSIMGLDHAAYHWLVKKVDVRKHYINTLWMNRSKDEY